MYIEFLGDELLFLGNKLNNKFFEKIISMRKENFLVTKFHNMRYEKRFNRIWNMDRNFQDLVETLFDYDTVIELSEQGNSNQIMAFFIKECSYCVLKYNPSVDIFSVYTVEDKEDLKRALHERLFNRCQPIKNNYGNELSETKKLSFENEDKAQEYVQSEFGKCDFVMFKKTKKIKDSESNESFTYIVCKPNSVIICEVENGIVVTSTFQLKDFCDYVFSSF